MPTEKLTFTGHAGNTLAARLDMPDGPHLATALFAHCFSCSKDITAARRIAARLSVMGITVLRFDFTGLGHSEGEFENTSFTSNVDDLIAASKALDARGMPPSLVIGHSLGGAAALKAAPMMESIKAVVTIGAPYDPAHVTQNFADAIPSILDQGVAEISLGGRPFRIGKAFLADVSQTNLKTAIAELNAALLVLHAPRDATVGIENASQIFLAAKHPKSFVTLDDADHLITRSADAEYVADVIAAWSRRYLELEEPVPLAAAPEGVMRVTEADANGFLQDVQSGRHHILADEPVKFGGTNMGLSPYGFISAGLGACTSMTIRMYARRKGWPLTGISVDILHAKEHAADAENPGEKVDHFERIIHLFGDLEDAQRDRLLAIANKCPVHRTLEQSSIVTTYLA